MESSKTDSYIYKSNNKEYIIELSKYSNAMTLKFTLHGDSDLIPLVYSGKYSFNELKEKNKFLRIYDSIEELTEFFKQIISQNKLSILNDLSGLRTFWSFIKGVSEDKIELILTKTNMEKDNIIRTLVNEVKVLKADNIKVNEKILELEKRINLLENKKKKNNGLINKIITDKKDANEFSQFLFKNQKMKFQMLYQATRDGDKISDIEKKIKGYSPTLFLFFTKKGIRCGGYTKALWCLDGQYKIDSSSFLYNFNKKKMFSVKNQNEAIYCSEDVACFGNLGNADFYIRNTFLSSGVYEAKDKYSYYCNNYGVQGENITQINELEIYHCIIN